MATEKTYTYTFASARDLFRRQMANGWNNDLTVEHRLWEAFEHGFTLARALEDDDFVNEDEGPPKTA